MHFSELAGDDHLRPRDTDHSGHYVPVPSLERRNTQLDVPGGLAVAIGLIIDDTVVVVENIARHLSPSRVPAKPATLIEPAIGANGPVNGRLVSHGTEESGSGEGDPIDKASGEITGAVLGSTLTTVLVFIPLAFIVGVYGQFFAALSWSLSIAVLVSMVISLTLVPVVAASSWRGVRCLRPEGSTGSSKRVYERGLILALRFPWPSLILSFLAVALGAVLVLGIPDPVRARQVRVRPTPLVKGLETGLMPSMDEGAFVIDYWAPSGTPLEQTEKMARDIEKVLGKNPDVESFVRRTGAELGLFATQTSRGDIQVVLRPAGDDPVSLSHEACAAADGRPGERAEDPRSSPWKIQQSGRRFAASIDAGRCPR